MSIYQHVLHGRLRIKVSEVKRQPQQAAEAEQALRQLEGVREVQANPTTGSVLVLFQPEVVSPEHIVRALQSRGCLSGMESPASQASFVQDMGQRLAETVVQSVFEMAMQRVVTALI